MTIQKGKLGILICLSITLLITALMLLKLSPLETLEERLLDYRFKIRGTIKPPDTVVIAAIDDKSIERVGRWAWSRDKMARLVERLTEAGAEIILFDVIFSEHDKEDKVFAEAVLNREL